MSDNGMNVRGKFHRLRVWLHRGNQVLRDVDHVPMVKLSSECDLRFKSGKEEAADTGESWRPAAESNSV
jgi:hypothetical protein